MSRYFYLTPVLGGPGAPRYPVTGSQQIIGRSEEAEIVLLEPTVSRKHATIMVEAEEVFLEDMGSKHGTFVNSRRVARARLKVGDIVVFGLSIVLRLEETDIEVPPATPLRVPGMLQTPLTPHSTADVLGRLSRERSSLSMETALHVAVSSPPDENRDQLHLQEQLVRARKLAAAGGYCLIRLPDVHRELTDLYRTLHLQNQGGREAEGNLTPEQIIQALEPILGRLTKVLETIRPLSRPRLQHPISLAKAMHLAVRSVEESLEFRHPQFESKVSPEIHVLADSRSLLLVIKKLLGSAARLNDRKGTVQIIARDLPGGADLEIRCPGGNVSEEIVSEMFEPFHTSPLHWEAVSFELFEARQIIMGFGGTLAVESALGQGCTFKVFLPG